MRTKGERSADRSIAAGAGARAALALTLGLATLISGGCDYERIDILVKDDVYSGRILSDPESVEARRGGILMKPGARLAVRTPFVTEFLGQFDVAILEGEGMSAYLRTVPHGFDTSRGIAFRYSTSGCSVRREDGRTIPLRYNAESETQTVILYNEAARVRIAVGCNVLYEEPTGLPGTEFIILETLPGSTVELRAVNYHNTDAK